MRYDERGFGRGQGRGRGWMERTEAELRHGWERVAANRGGRGRPIEDYDREFGVVGRLGHGYDADLGGPGYRYSGNEGLARGWTGGAHRGPAPHELDAGTSYDLEYGYGGGPGTHRGGTSRSDRAEGGLRGEWRAAEDLRARAFGAGYDREMMGYDREMRGGNARGWNSVGPRGHWDVDAPSGYDVDGNRYDVEPDPYDRDYRRGWAGAGRLRDDRLRRDAMRDDRMRDDRTDARYAQHRKTREETDYGDPFGDRQARTPIRVLRGGFAHHDDRPMRGDRYDNPGFDPYGGRSGTYGAYGGGYNRGYDAGFRDWF